MLSSELPKLEVTQISIYPAAGFQYYGASKVRQDLCFLVSQEVNSFT